MGDDMTKRKALTNETKMKISISLKEKFKSGELINWNKNKNHPSYGLFIERCRNMGKNNKGKKSQKHSKFMKDYMKKNHPMLGKHHSEISKLKMSKSKINLYKNGYISSSIGRKLDKKTKERLSKSIKNLWKDENYKNKIVGKKRLNTSVTLKGLWKDDDFREKRIKALNKSYENGRRKIIFKYPTTPELKLLKIIQENNLPFNYVGDGKIWFRGENHSFNPDFLSKNPKHIIEIFGDYWHNLPLSIKKDEERIRTYHKYGYDTLIIRGRELNDVDKIILKINRFIGEI